MNKKVLVALSGGVDSSVCALLCKENGYDVAGAIMKLIDKEDYNDINDAKKISEKLDIPFHIFDLREAFKKSVIDLFVSSYEMGFTPNPCVICNKDMKFGHFLNLAKSMDFDLIATGHYAKIEKQGDKYYLKKAKDIKKDQTYFLYNLKYDDLSKIIFPLGDMTKDEIRAISEKANFLNAKKKDSQDVCFISGDYGEFIKGYTGKNYPKGNFVDVNSNVIGTHNGLINYTIGQRKGLGQGFGKRVYVKDKDIQNNTVTLCDDKDLYSSSLNAISFNYLLDEKMPESFNCTAKIRYSTSEAKAKVIKTGEDTIHVEFFENQRAIAKGQSVVLYDGDIVLGGGVIV